MGGGESEPGFRRMVGVRGDCGVRSEGRRMGNHFTGEEEEVEAWLGVRGRDEDQLKSSDERGR